jgi:hypothetical protein
MINLSSVASRLPPARILIAAGLGLASYFVTTVWKATIDGEIRKYSDVVERAAVIEAQLNALPMFKASSRFWAKSIETQRLQIVTLSRLLKGTNKQPSFPAQLSVSNPYEISAVRHQLTVAQEFFGASSPEFKNSPEWKQLAVKSTRFATANPDYVTRKVGYCIQRVGFEDMTARLAFGLTDTPATSEFAEKFAAAYQKYWPGKSSIVGDMTTVEVVAAKLTETLTIGHSAVQDVLKMQFTANPFDPASEEMAPVFADQQQKAIECIEAGEDEVIDDFVSLLTDMRGAIAQSLVKPLENTKHNIERIEIVLYMASGLIALVGTGPAKAPIDNLAD